MDYERVFTALNRRKHWIALAVIACTGLTGFGASRMKREYQASATLMPQEQALATLRSLSAPTEAGVENDDILNRQDRIKTFTTVLSSPAILETVIRQQKLNTTPDKLAEQIEVKDLTSETVRLNVKDESPQRAAAIANGIVTEFTRYFAQIRSTEARKQVEVLENERKRANSELQLASASLQTFKQNGRISSLADQLRVGLDRTKELDESYNTAQARLREVTAQLASLQATLDRTPKTKEIRESATQTALLDKLRLDVSELQRAVDKELTVHTEEHPNVQRLKQELAEAQRRLDTESAKMHQTVRVVANADREALENRVRDLRSEERGLAARVTTLRAELANTRSRMDSYSGKDVQLALLQQRYTMAEQRLTTVAARLGQVKNVAELIANGTSINVVDRPGPSNPPVDLSQGRVLRLTALAFVLSMGVCIAMAIALELADKRVRGVADAETLMGLPVVSVVPQLPSRGTPNMLCLASENDPAGPMAESYHFLANHILRQTFRRESTVLMGVTAKPGQGATTALCNLAIALARAGRQVVLVEADIRRPHLHRVFITDNKAGLTDALQGQVPVTEALSQTHVENLRLLSAGSSVSDPWSTLWLPSMAQVIQDLRDVADYVIFNVPSATVFADALCVAPHVDGAILVMRSAEIPTGAEQKVRQWLDEVDVPVMGVVLNGVPVQEVKSYDWHRSYNIRPVEQQELALPAPGGAFPLRRAA